MNRGNRVCHEDYGKGTVLSINHDYSLIGVHFDEYEGRWVFENSLVKLEEENI